MSAGFGARVEARGDGSEFLVVATVEPNSEYALQLVEPEVGVAGASGVVEVTLDLGMLHRTATTARRTAFDLIGRHLTAEVVARRDLTAHALRARTRPVGRIRCCNVRRSTRHPTTPPSVSPPRWNRMGRRRRDDEPGARHHVMNRAIARRPLFESERDLRWLRSRVGREVRRGRLEGLAHRRLLVRYIDSNPVEARMCAWPWEYPRGSAADHVRRRPRPRLAREWVGTVLADQLESGSTRLDAYRACFSPRVSDAARVMFESSLERQNTPLHSEIDMVLEGGSALSERPSRALTVAALRSLAGSSWPEVAAFTCITRSRAQHLFAEERAGLLRTDRAYRAAFDGITRSLVAEVVD